MVTLISPYHNGDAQVADTPSSDTGDLHLGNVVSKLIRIILRSRLGSDSYYCKQAHHSTTISSNCCLTNPISSTMDVSGWELVVRIIHKSMVLERWIFHFNPTTTTKHDEVKPNQFYSPFRATADVILLLQSVYSHTRLLPVESLLDQLLLTKADFSFLATSTETADVSLGCHSSLADGFQTTDFYTMNDFRPHAPVATHFFKTIDCMDIQGQLSLQVMYDETIDKALFIPEPAQPPHLYLQQSQLPVPKPMPMPCASPDIVMPACKGKSVIGLAQFNDQQDVSMSTTTPYQLQVPPRSLSNSSIGMRPLCRLSLSAMTDDESSVEQDQQQYYPSAHPPPLAIPLSTSPIQYTHHGHTLAYSTSPLPNHPQKRRLSLPYQQQHNHGLVGSYEESLLSGRMSTLQPSKPIWFHAEIGVLGSNGVRSALKCPPHRSIAFPAQYYDGEEINNNNSVDEPSFTSATATTATSLSAPPYVGTMDLTVGPNGEPSEGYRLPSQGQLQIAIMNPHKSLVKLFLVPYNVSQMPRGMKTFLRQKSYSRPRSQSSSSSSPSPKYIIHLQICRTDKNRVFLYNKIRVVFVNRCLSSKETLFMMYDRPKDPAYTPLSS
ncbi:unnamed protein product [Absidia cylindrospora]